MLKLEASADKISSVLWVVSFMERRELPPVNNGHSAHMCTDLRGSLCWMWITSRMVAGQSRLAEGARHSG